MIYTFYSYKGGVGRSMALANLAKWFYLHGLRVVIVDWDLEAPGIENFFFDPEAEAGKDQIRNAQDRPGVIDLLITYQRRFPALPVPSWPKMFTRVLDSVLGETLPPPLVDVPKERLKKILNRYLSPSLRPTFDTVETSVALDILNTCLRPELYGTWLRQGILIRELRRGLPPTLNIPIERIDIGSLLKTMEESWMATPPVFDKDGSVWSDEPDVKGLLDIVAQNITPSVSASFEPAYVGPLLSQIEAALPEKLPLGSDADDNELNSERSLETKAVMAALKPFITADFVITLRREYAKALLEMLDDNLPGFTTMLYPIYEGTTSGNGIHPKRPTDADKSEALPENNSRDETPRENRRQPGLWSLSAGWRHGDRFPIYARNVQSFDWTNFYNSYEGEAYFEWMRNQLNDFADVVLIDSRTGVTEMGGVCTRQLADVVVSFVAPNGQNLTGVATMVNSFQRPEVERARRKWGSVSSTVDGSLDVVVIPARVETSEIDLRNDFELRFRRDINKPPDEFEKVNTTFWDLKIPYVPYFSYNERLVIDIEVGGRGRSEELDKAYKRVAVHLAMLAPEHSRIRKSFAKDLKVAFPQFLPGMALIAYAPGHYDQAMKLFRNLEGEGISLADEMVEIPNDETDDARPKTYLESCESLILVASNEAITSDTVLRQWRFARQEGKCVYLLSEQSSESSVSGLPTGAEVVALEDWQDLAAKLEKPCQTTRVPQMAPAPPVPFAHSKVLADLKSAVLSIDLNAPPRSRADVALCGMGGSGKSAVAAKLCHDAEVLNYFSRGVLWTTLGRNPDVQSKLATLYNAVTGEPKSFATADEAANAISSRVGRGCLIVIDDVTAKQDLRLFFKAGGKSAFIIITRDRALASESASKTFIISEVDEDRAADLITSQLEFPLTDGTSQRQLATLVQRLGYSPLAIQLAGAALRRRVEQGDDVTGAIDYLVQALMVQGVLAFDVPGTTDRNLSVARSLAGSLEQLTTEESTRFARLAEFDENQQIPLESVSRKWQLDVVRTEQLIQRLSSFSLVEFEPQQKTVRLHPLVRSYLIEQAFIGSASADKVATKTVVSGIAKARSILQGQSADIKELMDLAMQLKRENQFGFARRVLIKLRKDPRLNDDKKLLRKTIQQLSLCTRKDPDLPADERLDLSFEILKEVGDDLNSTTDQETLGLAGAIFKDKWEVDGQKSHLERSLAYYERGYDVGVAKDYGYTAINTAYLLDLLADQEATEAARAGTTSQIASSRQNRAETIRNKIVETLPALANEKGNEFLFKEWWFFVTIAEAFFGLRRYDEAIYWLKEAAALPNVSDWEYKATARQLASIARLNDAAFDTSGGAEFKESKAWEVLRIFLKGDIDAVRSSFVGKVGLALSGGGFRASLFHIGVLARLAELDVLRKVEVLSCVSGGSIIGAHYYLEARKLLESKKDKEINRQDYIDIVQRIEKDFLGGVQRNLRTRVAAGFITNLKMIFQPNYSRTERVGELFEREIFSRTTGENGPLYFNELFVQPVDEPGNFTPRIHNWRRENKVPVLILNATTLNTGHNWQFTASWMGEPPSNINTEVDGNDRLRRMYYEQAPKPYRRIRLGHAVAASACVPGLFEPLALSNLYPEKIVRLVDGGIHDNQGIGGLLGEDCTVVLVSDASGQMGTVNNPAHGLFGVSIRSNSILMSRVRDSEHRELEARRRSSLLRGLMFIHLKKDLEVDPVDWVGCDDPYDAFDESHTAEKRGTVTSYGVRKDIQQSLAVIRTDLDSFSDKEAYALMLSGYRMAGHEFTNSIRGFPSISDDRPEWGFLRIGKPMDRVKGFEDAHQDLMRWLRVGSSRTFKVWKLEPTLPVAFMIICSVLSGAFIYLYMISERMKTVVTSVKQFFLSVGASIGMLAQEVIYTIAQAITTPISAIAATIIFLALLNLSWRTIQTILRYKPISQILIGLVMGSLGWVAATIHLYVFDKFFLSWGRVKKVSRSMEVTVETRNVDKTDDLLKQMFVRHGFGYELRELIRPDEDGPMGRIVYLVSLDLAISTMRLSEEILSADQENIDSVEWGQKESKTYLYR